MRILGIMIVALALAGMIAAVAAPDLIVSGIAGAGTSPTYVTIRNVSSNAVPATNAVLKVYLNSPVPVRVGTPSRFLRRMGWMPSGVSVTFKFTDLPWPSNGVFRAFVDADNNIPESKEFNNQRIAPY